MKRSLLKIWSILPYWMQRIASHLVRPHHLVAVGALILDKKGKLLLCEHTYRRQYPWGLPGGDLKPGEDPVQGLMREVREETGMIIGAVELLLAENIPDLRQLTLTYNCKNVKGVFQPNDEVAGIEYFDVNSLPELSRREQATINKCLERLNPVK